MLVTGPPPHDGQRENRDSLVDRAFCRDEDVEVLFAAVPPECAFRVDEDPFMRDSQNDVEQLSATASPCRAGSQGLVHGGRVHDGLDHVLARQAVGEMLVFGLLGEDNTTEKAAAFDTKKRRNAHARSVNTTQSGSQRTTSSFHVPTWQA